MNLKEKWNKQNNSVKLLLKKLKRHDTIVVATAVVIATALCGGLIYLSTPVVTATAKEELMQDEMMNNEQTAEKLEELKEYLNGIDKTVAENQKSLSSYHEKNNEKNKETNEMTEKLTNNVTEKVVGLDRDMKELRELISKTESSIENLKAAMEKGDSDNSKNISESFKNLYIELEQIENQYNSTQEDTRKLMSEVEKVVKNGNKDLSKEMQDQYNGLLAQLSETDSKLSQQNISSMTAYKTEINAISEELNKRIAELDSKLNSGLGEVKNDINNVKNDVSNVSTEIGGVKNDISNVSTEINNLNTEIKNVDSGSKESNSNLITKIKDLASQMADSFTGVKSDIDGVNTGISGVKSDINTGINGVNAGIAGMKNDMNTGLNGVNAGIAGVNTNINSVNTNINGVNTGIAGAKTDINNKIDTSMAAMDKSIDEKLGNLSDTSLVDVADLKKYIKGELDDVNKTLGQVFQSVSDGKRLLASALLTKGVKVREDAKFAEIAAAIISIKTEYVIDPADVPGKVEYTYHFHKDGKGNECNESLVGQDRAGGCYSKANYHVHTDACYEVKTKYSYTTAEGWKLVSTTNETAENGQPFRIYYCPHCKKNYKGTNPAHYESSYDLNVVQNRKGVIRKRIEEKVKICEHEENDLVGYSCDCGYVHGQVIGAKISFDPKFSKYDTTTENGKSSNASLVGTSMLGTGSDGVIIDDSLFDFDGFEDEATEIQFEDESDSFGQTDIQDDEDSDVTSPENVEENIIEETSEGKEASQEEENSENNELENVEENK